MENKRSKGVTLFAWSVIILNVMTLPFLKGWVDFSSFFQKSLIITILLYSIIYAGTSIYPAVGVLRCKEASRKLLIILAFIGILDMAAFVPLNHKIIQKSMEVLRTDPKITQIISRQYDALVSKGQVKIVLSKEQFIKSFFEVAQTATYIVNAAVAVLFIFYGVCMIWFFSRPAVKTQFQPRT
jgi:hypothetical protein